MSDPPSTLDAQLDRHHLHNKISICQQFDASFGTARCVFLFLPNTLFTHTPFETRTIIAVPLDNSSNVCRLHIGSLTFNLGVSVVECSTLVRLLLLFRA